MPDYYGRRIGRVIIITINSSGCGVSAGTRPAMEVRKKENRKKKRKDEKVKGNERRRNDIKMRRIEEGEKEERSKERRSIERRLVCIVCNICMVWYGIKRYDIIRYITELEW